MVAERSRRRGGEEASGVDRRVGVHELGVNK